ncbi:MAG: SxtJ family membrane protein [Bdellovibrionota bacterium]
MSATKPKTERELREYGEVMALAALIFSAIGIWKRGAITLTVLVMLSIALVFLAFAFFRPESLRGAERRWMAFAEKLGTVMTYLVMFVLFYLIITPFGLMLRLFGKDLLSRRVDRARTTYWEPVDAEAASTRYFLPY